MYMGLLGSEGQSFIGLSIEVGLGVERLCLFFSSSDSFLRISFCVAIEVRLIV